MRSISLMPRLNAYGKSLLRNDGNAVMTAFGEMTQNDVKPFMYFAASGGKQDYSAAEKVSSIIREIALQHGFPDDIGQKRKAVFDAECTIALAKCTSLSSGEALRNDVWGFLTGVMLPDVVAWRFPDAKPERYEGGVRNMLQRLWIRGVTLDRGDHAQERWALVRALTEDAMVQIFERPSIGSDALLARSIAEVWLAASQKISSSMMEGVMRRATKLLRIRNEYIDLGYLSEDKLIREVVKAFSAVSGVSEIELTEASKYITVS